MEQNRKFKPPKDVVEPDENRDSFEKRLGLLAASAQMQVVQTISALQAAGRIPTRIEVQVDVELNDLTVEVDSKQP